MFEYLRDTCNLPYYLEENTYQIRRWSFDHKQFIKKANILVVDETWVSE